MTDTALASPAAPRPASPLGAAQPRYMQLAKTLLNEIESGKYPIGSQIPTELELCEQFGVSRATAREALRRLVQLGLVVRQPRVGTTVKALSAKAGGYRQNTADVGDLYQYATDTTLVIEHSDTLQIDASLAEKLEGSPGETWLHLRGRRHAGGQQLPICTTELWLHPAFRAIRGLMGPLPGAVHAAIEEQFGERVVEVEQEIRAVALNREQVDLLQAPLRSPALWVCRRYRNRHGQLVELTESTHPADRFSYSTVLRRDWEAVAR
jgi:GntR family transcriptional regulator